MNNRHTLFSYCTLAAALVAGCLFVQTGSGMDAALASGDGPIADGPGTILHEAAFRFAPPAPEDTSMPAEKVYKNIKTLRGLSAGEFMNTMSFMAASLGVRCNFCHVQGDFASDDKPEKNTARAMITMTHDINARNFSVPTVTCYTCHRGSPRPVAAPSLSQGDWQKLDLAERLKPDTTTTADAVLDRYTAALGGKALSKITSRVTQASELQPNGATATIETFQKAPNMYRSVSVASDPKRGTGIDVYNGSAGWLMMGNRPASTLSDVELEQLIRMAELFPAADIRRSYSSIRLLGREHVGDRDYYVIAAQRNDRTAEHLYFDAATGLLSRRYIEFTTALGPIPFAIDYSDWRETDGVKVPYTVKWSTLRESWTDSITQIRHNVAIADTMFAKPR